MEVLEKTLSNLIERQFPSFYQEEGPIFVEFVKQYYQWLETNQHVIDRKIELATVKINVTNTTVIGKNTYFEEDFNAGDKIAVFRENSNEYLIYTINLISNNTVLTLSSNPLFSASNVAIGTVKDQKNPLYHARHFFEYKDVDETTEQFLLYFKEKYLKNIRFETQTNVRELIKHSLDIYRSKGTERAIDLMFRLVFGRGAEVYYPGEDIFKLSDGKWYVPKYLEVSLNENNKRFAGKQLVGVTSGAKAFVETVIRKNVKGKLVDILFISAIRGNFQTGEVVTVLNDDILTKSYIKIIGSLTSVEIDQNGIGSGYKVGDVVDIIGNRAEKGKARVANVTSITGLVSYNLINGGYGYTSNAQVIVSEKVLTLSNVITNNSVNSYVNIFETITQPKAIINYNSANTTLEVDDLLFIYHANNDPAGNGRIISISGGANGTLVASIYSNTLNSTNQIIYVGNGSANTKQFNINATNGYNDSTVTANVMALSSNVVLYVTNTQSTFERGNFIYQINANNDQIASATVTQFIKDLGANAIIRTSNVIGVFNPSLPIINRNSNGQTTLTSQDIVIGVFDISNAGFTDAGKNFIYSAVTGSNGTVKNIGSGSLANLSFSNDLIYEETVTLNTDKLIDFANVALNAADYTFPKVGTEDKNTIIGDALTYVAYNVGKIQVLTRINRGEDYNLPPFITIYEPLVEALDIKDSILELEEDSNFAVGELVTQQSTGARGIVKAQSNSSHLHVERLRVNNANNFAITTNNTSIIVGVSSGSVANVSFVMADNNTKNLGINADVQTSSISGNGAITKLEVIDSGYGYIDGDEVSIENNSGVAFAVARTGLSGRGAGYYKQKGGFLSDQKKLFDGLYYQEYSYDILSSVALNKYEEMLKQLLHVAGTKYFGTLVYNSKANSNVSYSGKGFDITIEVPAVIVVETNNNIISAENDRLISREI